MTEVFEHNPGDHEDPLAGPTWIIGFLGAVLLAVIMLGLTALFYNARQEEEQVKIVQRDPHELVGLRASQLAQIMPPDEVTAVLEQQFGKLTDQDVSAIRQYADLNGNGKPHMVNEQVRVEGKNEEQTVQVLNIPIDQAMQIMVKEMQGAQK